MPLDLRNYVPEDELTRVDHADWTNPLAESRRAVLEELVAELTDVYRPNGVKIWLTGRHRLLNGRAIDLVVDGEFDRVRQAAASLVDGSYV